MEDKIIEHGGMKFKIQSYGKNDQSNICPIADCGSIIIDLKNKTIRGSYGKQDEEWKEVVSKIKIPQLVTELDDFFNPNANNNENKRINRIRRNA